MVAHSEYSGYALSPARAFHNMVEKLQPTSTLEVVITLAGMRWIASSVIDTFHLE